MTYISIRSTFLQQWFAVFFSWKCCTFVFNSFTLFFVANVNEIIFLIFSWSLLVYRNTIDSFWKHNWFLYQFCATFFKRIRPKIYFEDYLWLLYNIISLVSRNCFDSWTPIQMILHFSCLLALAKFPGQCWERYQEEEYLFCPWESFSHVTIKYVSCAFVFCSAHK